MHHVAWSHDGRWLAFTATYNRQIDIYVTREDGSDLRRVTDGSSLHVGQLNLSWLPGDRGLFFLGRPDTTFGLYHMKADGSQIAEYPRPAIRSTEGDLSPDGSRIVFVHDVDRRHRQLYVRNVDGSHLRALTSASGTVWADANPAWSPDGRVIIFDSIRDTTGLGEIYRIRADGADERRLTTTTVNNAMPTWSPDGRHISWVQIANRRATLVEAAPDGGNLRKVADDISAGTYSPDGQRIAASGRADDPRHWFLVVIRTDGTDKRRLVLRPAAQ